MIKRYLKNTAILLISVLFLACDKKLNLAPEGTLTENDALEDSANALGLLAGAYHSLWNASKGDAFTLGDLTTGIVSSGRNAYMTGDFDPRNSLVESFWYDNYATINLANVLIVKLPEIAEFRTGLREQFVGEAEFIRAMSYFNLIKLFGMGALQNQTDKLGVPLRLQPFEGYDASQNIPRAANKEVYDQIIDDLKDAMKKLPAAYTSSVEERTRATKGTAAALLSRIYLYRDNYEDCIKLCDSVLNNSNYELLASVSAVFPDHSSGEKPYPFNKEIIFAFPSSYNNDPTQYAQNNFYYNYGSIFANPDFVQTYAENDMRRTDLLYEDNGNLLPLKFSDPDDKDNIPMIRLAEVILNKAEALARLNGPNQESIDLLNKIHQRAFPTGQKPAAYTMADFSEKAELVDAILKERRWELAFEGHDRYDKIRTGQQPGQLTPEKYVFPIPQREINITNGLIKQNSGY